MRIAVLRSGSLGGALRRLFARAGHAAAFRCERDPRELEPLALLGGELAYNRGRRPELDMRFLRPARQRAA